MGNGNVWPLIFTSQISGRGNRIGPVCVSVWVCESYVVHVCANTFLEMFLTPEQDGGGVACIFLK